MNNISIIGRLPRDPESRTTPTGKNVAKFSLAVRKFKAAHARWERNLASMPFGTVKASKAQKAVTA